MADNDQSIFDDHKSAVRDFPQAHLADVIKWTRPTGSGDWRTTQNFYKSDLSVSLTLKTEEYIFSLIMYFVYSRNN